ncbi:hypothetical protein [Herpetosiphon geysericola]|uniref:hypothetical protein n=1 Tax=Herpetosiphon geysericola TaxID=70996 RepID=UPI00128F40E5|nr:hypothetical protein [Herpetosiphon geysericola]
MPPEGRCLVDPWWDDEPTLRYRNLADRLEPHLDIHHVHLASWFLARLWYLSAGTIEPALNVQAGHGVADGGHYLAYAVVENAQQQGIAELLIEGMPNYLRVVIDYRSQQLDPEALLDCLSQHLLAEPWQLAVCRIHIHDPEQPHNPKLYGWDGKHLLGQG